MAKRTARLKKLLNAARKTSDQTQRTFLRTEDVLSDLERREQDRLDREDRR